MISTGAEKAWAILAGLDPTEVERAALARYDRRTARYIPRVLGMDFSVFPEERVIRGEGPEAEAVLKRFGYFLEHSALWYLVGAKDIGLSGRHIRPDELKGGRSFFRGTHELPLKGLAGKYGSGREGFLGRAEKLGGRPLGFGDASVELLPLPRVPVVLILRLRDDEFPPRADLLFDSSVEFHVPLDMAWSIAMLSVLAML